MVITGRNCSCDAPCYVTRVTIRATSSVLFRITKICTDGAIEILTPRALSLVSGHTFTCDLDVALLPNERLSLDPTPDDAEVDCTWYVLLPSVESEFANRLYPLEHPDVQAQIEQMFENWSVSSLTSLGAGGSECIGAPTAETIWGDRRHHVPEQAAVEPARQAPQPTRKVRLGPKEKP